MILQNYSKKVVFFSETDKEKKMLKKLFRNLYSDSENVMIATYPKSNLMSMSIILDAECEKVPVFPKDRIEKITKQNEDIDSLPPEKTLIKQIDEFVKTLYSDHKQASVPEKEIYSIIALKLNSILDKYEIKNEPKTPKDRHES